MAKVDDNVFGVAKVTPKGRLFFYDFDSPNTVSKHPKNLYPSDKFDVTIGFKKDVNLNDLMTECRKVAIAAFGSDEGVDLPFNNGDEKTMASMKGMIILRAKCSKRPGLIDASKQRITESECDAGMWAKIQVTPMSYKSGKTSGVTMILKNAQVYVDTPYEPFGSNVSADAVAWGDDDDDDDLKDF